jgi:putative ABC transport system substrate-binding protein
MWTSDPPAARRLRIGSAALAAALGVAASAGIGAEAPEDRSETIIVALAASDHPAYRKAVEGAISTITAALPAARIVPMTLQIEDEASSLRMLVSTHPALVLAVGSRAARIVHSGVPGIPMVYAMVLDPGSIGLPGPEDAPSAGVTGISLDVPLEDQFALIRSMVPSARRVGVLYDPSISGDAVRKVDAAARSIGLKLVAQAVRSSASALDAAELLAPSVDVMIAIADPTVFTSANTRALILLWLRARVPLFAMSEGFVRSGALAALVPDADAAGERAGRIAVQMLHGTTASAPRPEPPPLVSLFLNQASATHLGVDISPEIAARARSVFAAN